VSIGDISNHFSMNIDALLLDIVNNY